MNKLIADTQVASHLRPISEHHETEDLAKSNNVNLIITDRNFALTPSFWCTKSITNAS